MKFIRFLSKRILYVWLAQVDIWACSMVSHLDLKATLLERFKIMHIIYPAMILPQIYSILMMYAHTVVSTSFAYSLDLFSVTQLQSVEPQRIQKKKNWDAILCIQYDAIWYQLQFNLI